MQFSRFSSEGERERKESTGLGGLGFELRERGLVCKRLKEERKRGYLASDPKASIPDGSVVASFL